MSLDTKFGVSIFFSSGETCGHTDRGTDKNASIDSAVDADAAYTIHDRRCLLLPLTQIPRRTNRSFYIRVDIYNSYLLFIYLWSYKLFVVFENYFWDRK